MSRTTQSIGIIKSEDIKDSTDFEIPIKICKNEPTEYDPTPRVLLVDGDSLLYMCVYFPENPNFVFETDEEYLNEAKHRLREKIQEISINIEKWFNIKQTIFFLGGEGNFRYKLYDLYKSQRPKEKPKYLKELKQYFIEDFNVILSHGSEADDYLYEAYLSAKDNCICAFIDKDLKGFIHSCPIYDFKTRNEVMGEFLTVSEQEARHLFATQVICGDATDFVNFSPGIGPAFAKKVINIGMTDYQYIKGILKAYLKAYKGSIQEAKKYLRLTYSLLKLYTKEEIKSLNLEKI